MNRLEKAIELGYMIIKEDKDLDIIILSKKSEYNCDANIHINMQDKNIVDYCIIPHNRKIRDIATTQGFVNAIFDLEIDVRILKQYESN